MEHWYGWTRRASTCSRHCGGDGGSMGRVTAMMISAYELHFHTEFPVSVDVKP